MTEQFEHILDQALELVHAGKPIAVVLTMFPGYEDELAALLPVAEKISMHLVDYTTTFASTLNTLPDQKNKIIQISRPSMKKILTTPINLPPVLVQMYKNMFHGWFKVVAVGLSAYLILFVGATSYKNSVLQETTQSSGSLTATYGGPSPMPPAVDSKQGIEYKELGMGYAQSTGLAAPDTQMTVTNILRSPITLLQNAVIPAIDTREYLKTGYNATIKTRDIVGLGTRIKTIVRGHGGHIDYVSLNETYGNLSFVIPKKEYDDFKQEIGSLVNARFITEQVSEDNRLYQKQSIETNAAYTTDNLNNLNQQKNQLTKTHQGAVSWFNKQIAQTASTTIQSQLRAQLNAENTKYSRSLTNLEASIRSNEQQMANLTNQNTNLLNDVETVQGTITLNFLTLRQLFWLLTPYNWLLVIAIIGWWLYRNYKKAERQLQNN